MFCYFDFYSIKLKIMSHFPEKISRYDLATFNEEHDSSYCYSLFLEVFIFVLSFDAYYFNAHCKLFLRLLITFLRAIETISFNFLFTQLNQHDSPINSQQTFVNFPLGVQLQKIVRSFEAGRVTINIFLEAGLPRANFCSPRLRATLFLYYITLSILWHLRNQINLLLFLS